MNLKTVPYSRLLKLEIASFAEDVIYIIKTHDPEMLRIDKVYNMLVDQQPNLDLLTKEYGSHPITQLIIPVRRKFIRYVRSIVYRMNLVVFEDANNATRDVVEAQAVTLDYLHRIDRCRSERERIGRVTGFLQVIDNDKEIKAAFTKFELMGDIELLRSAHSKLQKLLKKRIRLVSESSNTKMRELTAPVITALRNMFKQVEIAMLVNDDIDYLHLFNALNETITAYKNMVNRRLLHNKKKSEAKVAEAIKTKEEVETKEEEAVQEIKSIEPEKTAEKVKKDSISSKTIEDVPVSEVANMEALMKTNTVDEIEKDEVEKKLNPNKTAAQFSNNYHLPIKIDKRGK